MLDVVADVNLVYHLICVFLQCCREYHDLVVLGHVGDELDAAGSDKEEAVLAVVDVVDQSLIEVEHEGVDVALVVRERRQERWSGLGQVREIIRKDCFL